jgi:hypothetical protein
MGAFQPFYDNYSSIDISSQLGMDLDDLLSPPRDPLSQPMLCIMRV